jgi:alkanesulfonate monooxygenase SsuD/methylene tetrahydromethanopterin reductase-like flavin-dependent oxidoreductase (luciferase family)
MAFNGFSRFSFLTPGSFEDRAPAEGLEATLKLFELGEALGYDGAWVRQRHLETGISSAATFLAAATQRTRNIELGTAVIQIALESPFRLAEDLSLVDVLSHERLHVGLSAGKAQHADLIGPLAFDPGWENFDTSYARVERLVSAIRSEPLGQAGQTISFPGGTLTPRLRPASPELAQRLWYGGGSLRSATWAGEHGFHLLLSNVTTGEDTDDFDTAQLRQIEAFRAANQRKDARIAVGRVIIPTDTASPEAIAEYRAYEASRIERTKGPNGPRRTLFARDIVGTSAEIVAAIRAHPVLSQVDELRLELPYQFPDAQYRQILADFADYVRPALGANLAPHQ